MYDHRPAMGHYVSSDEKVDMKRYHRRLRKEEQLGWMASKRSVAHKVHAKRHDDSLKIKEMILGLKDDDNPNSEVKTNLLFAAKRSLGGDKEFVDIDGLSTCNVSVNSYDRIMMLSSSNPHGKKESNGNLENAFHIIAKDPSLNSRHKAGMNPSTLLTEHRRKVIFDAMLDSKISGEKRPLARLKLNEHLAKAYPDYLADVNVMDDVGSVCSEDSMGSQSLSSSQYSHPTHLTGHPTHPATTATTAHGKSGTNNCKHPLERSKQFEITSPSSKPPVPKQQMSPKAIKSNMTTDGAPAIQQVSNLTHQSFPLHLGNTLDRPSMQSLSVPSFLCPIVPPSPARASASQHHTETLTGYSLSEDTFVPNTSVSSQSHKRILKNKPFVAKWGDYDVMKNRWEHHVRPHTTLQLDTKKGTYKAPPSSSDFFPSSYSSPYTTFHGTISDPKDLASLPRVVKQPVRKHAHTAHSQSFVPVYGRNSTFPHPTR